VDAWSAGNFSFPEDEGRRLVDQYDLE